MCCAIMETPHWNFESTLHVYEPAEDSFLLLDVLESDLQCLKDKRPAVVVEIGSGSGVIISALAKALGKTAHCIAVDISESACYVTQETSTMNFTQVDVVRGDLSSCLRPASVDLLVFNPPYVVTCDNEISGTLQRAWAGGARGRVVIDRLLDQVDKLLSPKASFYLVVIKENIPEEIIGVLERKGFVGEQVAFKKIRGEQLSILRFSRCLNTLHS
uniref:Methyltransferase HEMK2 n=1 Tax=Graphocephala atropunctata TaxID=36148 RepID=A0A1B6K9T4_9HEMI